MSQDTFNLSNGNGATVRAAINAALQALASTNSGTSRPGTPYAGQLWLDTNTPSTSVWTLFMYDGTDDIALGTVDTTNNVFIPSVSGIAASKADQESASSTAKVVTPGQQQSHPSACKAWVLFDGTTTPPTINASYNVSGVSRSSTGVFVVSFDTDFSSDVFCHTGTCRTPGVTTGHYNGERTTAGTMTVRTFDFSSQALTNMTDVCVHVFGDQ